MISYPSGAPFDPPEKFPELSSSIRRTDPANKVYSSLRRLLRQLGLDAERFGTPAWNPLGDLVRPGDHVVVKPNVVRHFHGASLGTEAIVTHGSVLRPVLDYVILALKGTGSITVGDSPLQYSDFGAAMESSGMAAVVREARGRADVPIGLIDFRKERSEKRSGVIVARVPNDGDPEGYQVVSLDARSRFSGAPVERTRRFRVTQYDPRTMALAHNQQTHAYLLPRTVLNSNVFINLPKLKTHQKAGITAAMKNLVGINGSKDWLPHHTTGAVTDGGDEYPNRSLRKRVVSYLFDRIEGQKGRAPRRTLYLLERAVKATSKLAPFPDPYWEGSWHGNDTLWRMVHDLHRILFYSDAGGVIHDRPQRRYLALVDAVVAGEGEGPMRPTPRPTGLLLAGANPAAVDMVCCRLMGFDERKIPLLRHALGNGFHPGIPSTDAIDVRTETEAWKDPFHLPRERTLRFRPPGGWIGSIEL